MPPVYPSRRPVLEKTLTEELQHRKPTAEEQAEIEKAARGDGVQKLDQNGTNLVAD